MAEVPRRLQYLLNTNKPDVAMEDDKATFPSLEEAVSTAKQKAEDAMIPDAMFGIREGYNKGLNKSEPTFLDKLNIPTEYKSLLNNRREVYGDPALRVDKNDINSQMMKDIMSLADPAALNNMELKTSNNKALKQEDLKRAFEMSKKLIQGHKNPQLAFSSDLPYQEPYEHFKDTPNVLGMYFGAQPGNHNVVGIKSYADIRAPFHELLHSKYTPESPEEYPDFRKSNKISEDMAVAQRHHINNTKDVADTFNIPEETIKKPPGESYELFKSLRNLLGKPLKKDKS